MIFRTTKKFLWDCYVLIKTFCLHFSRSDCEIFLSNANKITKLFLLFILRFKNGKLEKKRLSHPAICVFMYQKLYYKDDKYVKSIFWMLKTWKNEEILACFIFLYFQPWKTCSHLKRKSFSLSSSLISELGGLMMKSFPENFQLCFVWTSSLINESFGKVIFQGRFHQPTVEQNKYIDFIFYRKFHNAWRNLYFKSFHECKTTFIKLKTMKLTYM